MTEDRKLAEKIAMWADTEEGKAAIQAASRSAREWQVEREREQRRLLQCNCGNGGMRFCYYHTRMM